MTKQNNDKTEELVIKRIFEAPRISVWNAWTNPEYLMKWWGPKFYTSPFCKIDLSVGGKYLICLRSPKGQEFWSTGYYKKITPLQQLIYTDSLADKDGNIIQASMLGFKREWPRELLVTVTFKEINGRTKLKIKHTGFPTDIASKLAEIGWNESLDKLNLILTTREKFNLINLKPHLQKASYDLLARAESNIQAPASQVWNALVNPEMIKQYMFDTDVVSQWTVGSSIVWKGKWQGKQYEDKGTILDIKKMEMIKYNHFSPLTGQPDIPENYHTVTIRLTSAGERTTIQLTQDNNTTDQAREHSEKMWNQMLDKMKNLLEK